MKTPARRPEASRSTPTSDRVWRPGRFLVPCLLAATLVGCGGEPAAPPETYTTRGIVRQVGMGTPGGEGEVLIHHEAIASFRDDRGEVVGMESMAMPFTVAEPSLAEGLEAGDRIGFTFEVRWEGGPPLQLTTLEALDDGVRLDFEPDPEGSSEGSVAEPDAGEGDSTAVESADPPASDDGHADH